MSSALAKPFNGRLLVASLADYREHLAATSILTRNTAVTVTMSAGVAVLWDGADFNDLYTEADLALYRAKALGRNRICYSHSFEALVDRTAERGDALWRDDGEEDLTGVPRIAAPTPQLLETAARAAAGGELRRVGPRDRGLHPGGPGIALLP